MGMTVNGKTFNFQVDSLRYHNSHVHHLRHQHNSVPNSPNETEMGHRTNHSKLGSNSANTSPISANRRDCSASSVGDTPVTFTYNTNHFVRTSRSEDQLQMQKDAGISAVDIDIEEDITSSLNTLLDTRLEGGSNNSVSSTNSDRIVWTYNAPVTAASEQHKLCSHTLSNGSSSSQSSSSTTSSSPLRSGSPASPTSVSSSVMSSQSGSRRMPYTISNGPNCPQPDYAQYHHPNGDFSMSEVISNISSPDYHDDDSMGIRDCVMEISDHSDSDSTLLVSEPRQRQGSASDGDHRIVIQVKGPEKDAGGSRDRGKQNSKCNDRNSKSKQMYYGYQVSKNLFTHHRIVGYR